MARESQKDLVRRLLRERGAAGVGARELTFQHHITRAAAIVHTLRTEERMPIETKPGGPGEMAVYVLAGPKLVPRPPDVPQSGLLPDEELPEPISWEALGAKMRQGAH